ncbi:MAG: polysaccharide biosynthesis protein [Bdellovibrionales bacterium]
MKIFGRIRLSHLLTDALVIAGSVYLSVFLRVGTHGFEDFLPIIHRYLPLILITRLLFLYGIGSYRILWRYVSAMDAFRLAQGVAASTALIVFTSFFLTDWWGRLPRSVYFIDAAVVTGLLMGVRLLRRIQSESQSNKQIQGGLRTLIYGAGMNGKSLASRFRSDATLNLNVVGFVDDDPQKQGLSIANTRVLGTRHDLESLMLDLGINQLIISIPNVSGAVLRQVVTLCARHNVRPLMTSRFATSHEESWRDMNLMRSIDLNDLLNRPACEIDVISVQNLVRGKRVLVTGAGGSIGSELARQVLSHGPAKLIILDHSEYNLFEIDRELRAYSQSLDRVVPILLDLKDHRAVQSLMQEHRPDIVIHAAAYKHVHLVETNPFSAIQNNIGATKNLLESCKTNQVEVFLLISTDKAVNPAGVMGATKRVCELMTTATALETGRRFGSVRFGNVLGSSGSLIPTLTEQIRKGGPVTVTHIDMTRYFMLIPEAVSLVLKGCTISKPGDINVLKMGEPVKIVDIARNMIALSGKTEEEIPIVFTGPRPGEKLFEELYIRGDELKTEHPDILTLPMGDSTLHLNSQQVHSLKTLVDKMLRYAEGAQREALALLTQLAKTNMAADQTSQPDQVNR